MLKTMSAALLAASVIAAPAFAQVNDKATTAAPAIKSEQKAPVAKTEAPAAKTEAPVAKTEQPKTPAATSTEAKTETKSKALNANAKVNHRKNYRQPRHHKHMGLLTTHVKPVAAIKRTSSAAKHG